jgi:hypothetical protein
MSDPNQELNQAALRLDAIASALRDPQTNSLARASLAEEASAISTRVAELIATVVRPA